MRDPRLLLRDVATALLIGVPLLALAALAWATRNLEHPRVVAAGEWPVVGALIERTTPARARAAMATAASPAVVPLDDVIAREARRSFTDLRIWFDAGTEVFADPTAAEPHTVIESPTRLTVSYQSGDWVSVEGRHRGWTRVEADPTDLAELPSQYRQVWVRPGDRLRSTARGEVIDVVDVIANLPVTAAKPGDWVQVVYRDRKLWKRAPEFTSGPPPLGSAPTPIRPLAAVAITPDRLQSARGLFRGAEVMAESGPYRVLGDSPRVRAVAATCDRRLSNVDGELDRITGTTPVGGVRETLLLFADREDYRQFVASGPFASADPDGYALAAQGFAASYLDGVSDREACSVLVHETVHLAARRHFGPGLPPWLAEGLATWLEGRRPAPVDPALGRELVRLNEEFYSDPDGSLENRYRQAAAITEKLLTDPRLAPATRAFLADRAAGRQLARGPGMAVEDFWSSLILELEMSEGALWRMLAGPQEEESGHPEFG